MTDKQVLDQILEQAYGLIQQGEAEQAISLGNQLLEHRHARGFEVIALAYEQQGKPDEAIGVLKDGVSKVPAAWPLWELLGNLHSDQDSQGQARDCYNKALNCPGSDKDSINYNIAIMLKREGKFQEAHEICNQIGADDLKNKAKTLRIALLNGMNQYDEAITYANSVIADILGQQDLPDEDMQDLARAYAELGRSHWEGRYDRQAAWESAWKSLEWDRSDNSALWLVREIIGRKSQLSKWYKLVIEGKWHFPLEQSKETPNFLTTYEVVADSPEDALQFAQDLEPVEVRPTMRIDSTEDMGQFPDNQQGVYWRSAYGFFMQ